MSAEGDDLNKWLSKWKLTQYEQQIRQQGVESPNDFQYIKSKQQFDNFCGKLGDMPFMHALKLQDAWSTIVPKTKQETSAQIHFLGDAEKNILNQLCQRYKHISDDLNAVQKANNEFNESVVAAKQMVNSNIEKIILAVNNEKEELLNQIDVTHDKNKKIFHDKLQHLQRMNEVCLYNKRRFETISTDKQITSNERLNKLTKLLAMNVGHKDDDDEKKTADNYDNYVIIGNKCIVPGKMNIKFDESVFNEQIIGKLMSVICDEVTQEWNTQQSYVTDILMPVKFDKAWSEQYYTFNDGDKTATWKSGEWSVVRLLSPVNKKNSTVKFTMNSYGWFGIGDYQVHNLGFPGYTPNGWMIVNSNCTMYHNNSPFQTLSSSPGKVENKVVEMSFDFDTKIITVTVDNKKHLSPVCNIDIQNNVYFVWTVSSKSATIKLLE